ncbi:MAG: hypothetical protein ACYDH4_00420 [Candidatus Cryosericum sp.]
MNPGQEKFFTFIMERVQTGKQEEARTLLDESFSKQANGTLNQAYLDGFIPRMIALLKPESIGEVKAVMSQFGQGFMKS